MRIAYIHDRLNNLWWAERIFAEMINGEWTFGKESKMYTQYEKGDERRLFTMMSAYDRFEWLPVSSAGKIERGKLWWVDPRWLMPFYPLLMKRLSKQIRDFDPDIVYISSFSVAKNIDVDCKKVFYCHSPMQYIWDVHDEYVDSFGGGLVDTIKKKIFIDRSKRLRLRDRKYTHFDAIYANSSYTQWLIRDIYGQESELLQPEIDTSYLPVSTWYEPGSYYLFMGRLVRFSKHVDMIIEACNELWVHLAVAWTWPDEEYLRSIAWPSISFAGYISDSNIKYSLLAWAKALINITKESYGIVTAEAVDLWVPVIGYNQWATPSLVWADSVLLDEQSSVSLIAALEKKTS